MTTKENCAKLGCVACELAKATGRPHSEFETDESDYPSVDDLENQ